MIKTSILVQEPNPEFLQKGILLYMMSPLDFLFLLLSAS